MTGSLSWTEHNTRGTEHENSFLVPVQRLPSGIAGHPTQLR